MWKKAGTRNHGFDDIPRRLGSHHASAGATVAALAAAFDKHLAPACRQPHTRADYWRAWRLVVTWAVARQAVHDILRMPLDTLKALTWDIRPRCVGCSHGGPRRWWRTGRAVDFRGNTGMHAGERGRSIAGVVTCCLTTWRRLGNGIPI